MRMHILYSGGCRAVAFGADEVAAAWSWPQ